MEVHEAAHASASKKESALKEQVDNSYTKALLPKLS
jgi:hypothetical protein